MPKISQNDLVQPRESLTNNRKLHMQIELYKMEEVTGEAGEMAADSAAIDLINSLGLNGQMKLINTETATRIAFRRMTEVEREVYGLLFPEVSKLEKFDSEIIPLRVLEIAREAKESGQFAKFEVWHARTRKEDPLLVGIVGDPSPQPWDQDYISVKGRFLIARWGEALIEFDKLREMAKKLWIVRQTLALKKQIGDCNQTLSNIELEAENKFSAF